MSEQTALPPGRFPEGAALIFGGSGGLGLGIAQAFAKAGSRVALVYRSSEHSARDAASGIAAEAGIATIHQADVTMAETVTAAVAQAMKEHGRLHTIVFAAGPHVEQLRLADITQELWRRAIETETHGFFNVFKATVEHLRAQGGGSYVHLGSAGDLWWPTLDGLSVVPKAANEALVRGIAKEEGPNGIRANTVLVGVIAAGQFLEHLRRGTFDQKWIDGVQALLPIKRWGTAEEIGHAALFLATNGYVSGQQINVSGGFGI